MTLPSLNLKPLPHHQRALHRAGIETGILEVDYQPEPPFFADQRQRYSFARLTLGRPLHNNSVDPVLAIKFQRHMLAADEQSTPSLSSHPRFDFGPYPWSHFYGPRLVPDALPLAEAHKLSGLVRAASTVGKLLNSPEVNNALRSLSPGVSCELTLYLAALQSQDIAIRVLHHLNGGVWSDDEVLVDQSRFRAGSAAPGRPFLAASSPK